MRKVLIFLLLCITMVGADFDTVVGFTFKAEGSGLDKTSSHSRYGVSKETIKRYNKKYKTKYTVNNLTKSQAKTIAKKFYWEYYNIDIIDNDKLAISIFDFMYNSNPTKASKYIEKAAKAYGISGIKQDGIITKKEMKLINTGGAELANIICDKRLGYMQSLKVWKTYKKGWSKRVNAIKSI